MSPFPPCPGWEPGSPQSLRARTPGSEPPVPGGAQLDRASGYEAAKLRLLQGQPGDLLLWGQAQAVMCTLAQCLKSGAAGESGQRQDGANASPVTSELGGTHSGPAPSPTALTGGRSWCCACFQTGTQSPSCSRYVRHLEMSVFLGMIASVGSSYIKNKM